MPPCHLTNEKIAYLDSGRNTSVPFNQSWQRAQLRGNVSLDFTTARHRDRRTPISIRILSNQNTSTRTRNWINLAVHVVLDWMRNQRSGTVETVTLGYLSTVFGAPALPSRPRPMHIFGHRTHCSHHQPAGLRLGRPAARVSSRAAAFFHCRVAPLLPQLVEECVDVMENFARFLPRFPCRDLSATRAVTSRGSRPEEYSMSFAHLLLLWMTLCCTVVIFSKMLTFRAESESIALQKSTCSCQ